MKRTKVFVTGMAAMALSFGLLMMGCDSGSGGGDDGIADVSIPTINVAAGDTALVVSTTGGTLKAGVGVFINAAGEAVTITTEATVQGSFKVTPAKVTQAGGKIIVTGLNAAAAGPANTATSIALKAGNGTVTVTIKADAQTDKVTGPAARVGKPAVIADNPAYKFGTTPGTDVIVFDPTDGLTYDINNATAAGSTGVAGTFDADLDAEIVKALTDLRKIVPPTNGTFEVTSGAVTGITTTKAVTIPADTELFFPDATLTLVKNKAFTIAGTLKVGSADDSVTFKNVVITVAAASDLVLTGDGIVTLAGAQADSIKINNGGRITTKNAGVLTVDFTTIVGDWGVTGGSGTVTITSTGEGVTTINGSALASALTAMAPDSSITQAKGSGNSLTLTATTTIDLKGIAGSPVGAILLETGTDPGCLTFAGGNGVIKTANTGTASSVTPGTALGIATSTATGKLLVSAANGITVKTNPDTNLVSITGATANTTLKGHTTAEASTPIDADLVVTAS